MLWIKPLMTGGVIKERYRNQILETVSNHPENFKALLNCTIGTKLSAEIYPLLANSQLDETIPYTKKIRRAAWFLRLSKQPMGTLYGAVSHYYQELLRRSERPSGSIILVAGVDKQQKREFINLLEKELTKILIKDNGGVSFYETRSNNKLHCLIDYWTSLRKKCMRGKVFIFGAYVCNTNPNKVLLNELLFMKITPAPDVIITFDENNYDQDVMSLTYSRNKKNNCMKSIEYIINKCFKKI
jgi:hypothetical protein